jgi:hypothetical protein
MAALNQEGKVYMGIIQTRGRTWEKAQNLKVQLNRGERGGV